MSDSTISPPAGQKILDLSASQLRFVSLLVAVLTLVVCIQFIRHHANPSSTTKAAADQEVVIYGGVFQLDPTPAPADSLELLSGIGPALAQRIVNYRSEHRFERVEDLEQVSGIGPQLVRRLTPFLVIGAE